MKTWLLPLTTILGAAGAFTLMLATQAAPMPENGAESVRPVRQMEHQNRVREWSQGLGVHQSGSSLMARAEKVPAPEAGAPRTSDGSRAGTRATDHEERHERGDRHDRDKNKEHEDDEAAS